LLAASWRGDSCWAFVLNYLIAVICAALTAIVITPIVSQLARRWGVIDLPGGRKVHEVATPRLGGVAVYLATITGVAASIVTHWVSAAVPAPFHGPGGLPSWRHLLVAGAATSLAALGAADDAWDLRPRIKLGVEIVAALAVIASGYQIRELFGFSLGWISLPATLIWIVLVVNAINLIDGLDGLAAGVGLISAATMLAIFIHLKSASEATVTAGLCGALLGFLSYNFYPATIFLGDSGSLLLGFLLAVFSLATTTKAATLSAIAAPLAVLGLPLAEVALTTIRRALRGLGVIRLDGQRERYGFVKKNPSAFFTADREHIHHRLLALGMTQRRAVLVMWAVTALCGMAGFALAVLDNRQQALLLALAIAMGIVALRAMHYPELHPLGGGLFLPLFDLPFVRHRAFSIVADAALAVLALGLAVLLAGERLDSRPASWMVALLGVQIVGLWWGGLYARDFRYPSLEDGLATVRAAFMALGLGWATAYLLDAPLQGLLLPITDGYLLISLILSSRLTYCLFDRFFKIQQPRSRRVIIFGAGLGGIAALREIELNPHLGLRFLAFADDDIYKWRRLVRGFPVLDLSEFQRRVAAREFEELIISTVKLPRHRVEEIVAMCHSADIAVSRFHVGFEELLPRSV